MPDRSLTDDERAKLRDYQTAEILRRRNGSAPPRDEPDVRAEVRADVRATNGCCPGCGTPYGKRRRCHVCSPGGRAKGPRAKKDPTSERPEIRESSHVIRESKPAIRESTPANRESGAPDSEYSVIARNIDGTAASDHLRDVTKIVNPPLARTVASLRAVVELLAGLPDDDARWVVDSAYALSRSR